MSQWGGRGTSPCKRFAQQAHAVAQITKRRRLVSEASEWLGVSKHSLYA